MRYYKRCHAGYRERERRLQGTTTTCVTTSDATTCVTRYYKRCHAAYRERERRLKGTRERERGDVR
jgi:hypothetical protein